jgi:hypothetical protein
MPYMACNFHIALNFVSSWAVSSERWAVVSVPVTWQIRKIQQLPGFSDEHFHHSWPMHVFDFSSNGFRRGKAKKNVWLFAESLDNWAPYIKVGKAFLILIYLIFCYLLWFWSSCARNEWFIFIRRLIFISWRLRYQNTLFFIYAQIETESLGPFIRAKISRGLNKPRLK